MGTEKRENCRECRSSVESCAADEEEKKVSCSLGIAVENQRKEAYIEQVCLELEDEEDATKKEKKKKKKQEQRNRKHSSESEDKRYSAESRSSVESTTLSDEESSAANEAGLDIVKAESEDGQANETRQ